MPEDLKVVTYDGMDITRLCYPRVTSICQDIRFLAETCSKTMIKLIEGREPVPQNQILSVKIQQGGTTYPVDLDGNKKENIWNSSYVSGIRAVLFLSGML